MNRGPPAPEAGALTCLRYAPRETNIYIFDEEVNPRNQGVPLKPIILKDATTLEPEGHRDSTKMCLAQHHSFLNLKAISPTEAAAARAAPNPKAAAGPFHPQRNPMTTLAGKAITPTVKLKAP